MSDYVDFKEVDEVKNPNEKGYEEMPNKVKKDIDKIMGGNLGSDLKKTKPNPVKNTHILKAHFLPSGLL